jgi:hypothetical protein
MREAMRLGKDLEIERGAARCSSNKYYNQALIKIKGTIVMTDELSWYCKCKTLVDKQIPLHLFWILVKCTISTIKITL